MPRIHRLPGSGTELPDLLPLSVKSCAAEVGATEVTSLTLQHHAEPGVQEGVHDLGAFFSGSPRTSQ
jgi:hypothetical protein